jgi:hypothetical protein
MLTALVGQAVTSSPVPLTNVHPGFWEQLAPKDWVSFAVGASGFAIAAIKTYVSWSDRRQQMAIQEFLKMLADFEKLSRSLAERIQDSLVGKYGTETPDDHHAQNLRLENKLSSCWKRPESFSRRNLDCG